MPDDPPAADATEHDMADHLAAIAQQSQRIAARFLSGQGAAGAGTATDPLNLSAALGAMARSLAEDPSPLIDAQMKWWDGYLRLWQQGAQRLQGEEPAEPVAAPEPDDRRFRDPAWTESWVFDHLKQSYLLTAACMQSAVGNLRGLDEKDAAKLAFYTRQFVDALAPTNFLATNPAALKETAETRGENLLRGLRNVLDDLERNEGRFAPRMSDEGPLRPGRDHRHDARKGRLPERADAADPVCAEHRDGVIAGHSSSCRPGSTSTTCSICGRRTPSSDGPYRRAIRSS